MSDAASQATSGPLIIPKFIEFDPIKGADKNIAAAAELLDELQRSNLQSIIFPEPLKLYFGQELLTDPSYRRLRVTHDSRPPTSDQQKAEVFLTDVVRILKQIYDYLVLFKDASGATFVPAEAQQYIEAFEGQAYRDELTIANQKRSEIVSLVALLSEAAHQALGETASQVGTTEFDSLSSFIYELKNKPRLALTLWENAFLPLARNLSEAQLSATAISLSQPFQVGNAQALITIEHGQVSLIEVRQLFHFFVLALREIVSNPQQNVTNSRQQIVDILQILTSSEVATILGDSSILFPEELSVAYTLAGGTPELITESDKTTINAFLRFFADPNRNIISRLRSAAIRSDFLPGGAEEEAVSEGAETQDQPPPPVGQQLSSEELTQVFQTAIVSTVVTTQLGVANISELTNYAEVAEGLRLLVSDQLASSYLAEWQTFLESVQTGQTQQEGLHWDPSVEKFVVSPEFLSELQQRGQTIAEEIAHRNSDQLSAQLIQLTLAQAPALPEEEPENTALGSERFDAKVLSQLVANWNNLETPLTFDQRLQVTSSVYRREAIRLQNILVQQFFNYYELPISSYQDVPVELRRLFADEVEYSLRSKSPSELALMTYPGHRLDTLRQIFFRVSRNPVFIDRLQIVFDQYANRLNPEKLAEKTQNFDSWLYTSLNPAIDLSFDDLSYVINLQQQQQNLVGSQAEQYLENELRRYFSATEAEAVNAGLFLNNLQGLLKSQGLTEPSLNQITALGGLYFTNLSPDQQQQLTTFLHTYAKAYLGTLALSQRNTDALLKGALSQTLNYEGEIISIVGQAQFDHIQRTLDSLLALKKDPRFLSTLNPDRFELIFRVKVTDNQLQRLIPELTEYWKSRAVYWEQKLNVNNISGSWEELTDEDILQLRGRAGNDYLAAAYRQAFAVSQDMERVADNEKILMAFALEESQLDNELQILRQTYVNNLKLEIAGLLADNEALDIALENDALLSLNQYIGPPSTAGLIQGDGAISPKAVTNPVQRLQKPGRFRRFLGNQVGRRLGGKKRMSHIAASMLGNAVIPGSGAALKGASLVLSTVFGEKGKQLADQLPLLGIVGIAGTGLATGLALAGSTLAKVFSGIGTFFGGIGGGVLGAWLGFGIEKVGLGGLGGLGSGSSGSALSSTGLNTAGQTAAAGGGQSIAAKVGSALKTAPLSVGAQAVAGTAVVTFAGLYVNQLITTSAFLDVSHFAELVGETSPYVEVTKRVTPNVLENNSPATLTYTITITPKENYIIIPQPTEITDDYSYLGGEALDLVVPIENIRQQLGTQPINPGETREISYTIADVSGVDVQVTNTFNLVFLVEGEEGSQNIRKSAFVKIGNPKLGCFEFMPAGSKIRTGVESDKDWTDEEIAKIQEAFSVLSANSQYNSLLCTQAGSSQDIKLYRISAGDSAAYYGWAPAIDKVVLYDNALAYGILSTRYTLTHELGHILDYRNSDLKPGFLTVKTRAGCYSYPIPDSCDQAEAFAEAVALFIVVPGYPNLAEWDLSRIDSPVYNWILENIFGGENLSR